MAIMKCSCKNSYQDAKYGAGRRVCNETRPPSGSAGHRCTVCDKDVTQGGNKKRKK